jgi:transcriptional regulator with XRE-family HTH domain
MDPLSLLLKDLGDAIGVLRRQTGLSQEHFGDKIGLHRTQMGRLERGKVNPTIKTLYLVATGLGVKVADLFARAVGQGPVGDGEGGGSAQRRSRERRPTKQRRTKQSGTRRGK